MGLFGKKKKEEKKKSEVPALPDLPKLPEFPSYEDYSEPKQIHKLPSYPSNSLGTKFSRDSIKEAVTGRKEGEDADEFADEDEMRMMQEPYKKPRTTEIGEERERVSGRFRESVSEPVFIRIDRFEDALRIFNETKRKISEIERVLEGIKMLKEKEDKELQSWENEIRNMKGEIERIDKDIFSKI